MSGATARKLDFTDVRDGGNFNRRRRPAGEYRARITDVADHESKEGNDNYVFTVQIDGDRRSTYPYYCGLQTKQLWKLRNLLVAVGLKPPTGKLKIDPNKLVGRSLGVILDDDEYEGRVNSVVSDVFPVSEGGDFLNDGEASTKAKKKSQIVDDDDEDDENDTPPKKSSKKSKKVVDDDDEDEDEDDEPAPKKSSKKKAAAVDDDEDDDDEDDDEPPVKKSKKSPKKKSRRDDDDEDDDLDTDDL